VSVRLWRGRSELGAAIVLCVALTGCRHQQPATPLPPQTPNVYVPPPPQPNLPPMQAPPPASVSDVKPAKARVKPKNHTKKPPLQTAALPEVKSAGDVPAPSVSPAAAAAPAEDPASTLGALSPGGASTPQQQQIGDAISAVEHRLKELPAATTEEQKKRVTQVRLFLKQATDALKTGDVEGARNLATKAGLLLDDLLK
jgi:hypothetical protein